MPRRCTHGVHGSRYAATTAVAYARPARIAEATNHFVTCGVSARSIMTESARNMDPVATTPNRTHARRTDPMRRPYRRPLALAILPLKAGRTASAASPGYGCLRRSQESLFPGFLFGPQNHFWYHASRGQCQRDAYWLSMTTPTTAEY